MKLVVKVVGTVSMLMVELSVKLVLKDPEENDYTNYHVCDYS